MSQPYPISRETREEAIFLGSGVATYGPFDLKIFDAADLQVWTKLQDATDWVKQTVTITKTANLAFDTFTITFPAIVANTTKIKVISARVHERSAGLSKGTRLDMDALEKELTKQGTILQELARDRDRAVKMDFDAGDGLIVQDGLEDGQTLMKQGNYLVPGPNVGTINDAITYRDQAAASAADASTSAGKALTSQIAAAASAAYALEVGQTFDGVRTMALPGAVSRTLKSVSQDWVNAKEIIGDYLGDKTSVLNTAMSALSASGGGRIIFDGEPSITTLNIPSNITLEGMHERKALFHGLNNALPMFVVSGINVKFIGFSAIYDATPVAGATAIAWYGAEGKIENVTQYNSYNSLDNQSNGLRVRGYTGFNFENTGIRCTAAVGGMFSQVKLNAGNTTRGANGSLRLFNQVEGISFSDIEILAGTRSIITGSTDGALGHRPAYLTFSGMYLDGARLSSYIEHLYASSLVNTWVSAGREGGDSGMQLLSGCGNTLTNTQVHNCGHNGIVIGSGMTNISLLGGQAFDNHILNVAGDTHVGVEILAGCKNVTVRDFATGNGLTPPYAPWTGGHQDYGVRVGSGCDRVRVKDISGDTTKPNRLGVVYEGTAASSTVIYRDNF